MREFSTSPADLAQAAALLRDGGLIAFPTETVYGLGANACDDTAVQSIYAAKGRPSFNPLIAHFANAESVAAFVEISAMAQRAMDAFWPGALTLVLPLKPGAKIAASVTAGLPTLAVRVPNHAVAQALLAAAGTPIAAPSANPSGRISPTTPAHVRDGLGGKIDGLVSGGPCKMGLESTILTFDPNPTILRPGGVTRAALQSALGCDIGFAGQTDAIQAPGQLASHYAPTVPVRLNAAPQPGESFLGFGPGPCDINLSETGDLAEAAERLFAALHALDAVGKPIAVAPIPETGLGRAINDRLRRAAA